MLVIEETHYMRRLEQPSPAPKPSKEFVVCLLGGDPSLDNEEGRDARKRARTKGRSIRLDMMMAHCKSEHPEATRDGNRSLLSFGFTRQCVRVTTPLSVAPAVDPSNLIDGSLERKEGMFPSPLTRISMSQRRLSVGT